MNRRRAASNATAAALEERSLHGQKKHTRDPHDIVSWGVSKEVLMSVHDQLFNNDVSDGYKNENNSTSTPSKTSVATRESVYNSSATAQVAVAAAVPPPSTSSTGGYWTSWYRSATNTPATSPVPVAVSPAVGEGSFSEKHFARLQVVSAELFDEVLTALAATKQGDREEEEEVEEEGEQGKHWRDQER